MSQMASTVADAFVSIRAMLLPQAQGPSFFTPEERPFGAGPAQFPGLVHPPVHSLVYHSPQLSTSTSRQIHTPNDEPWPGADFEDTNVFLTYLHCIHIPYLLVEHQMSR